MVSRRRADTHYEESLCGIALFRSIPPEDLAAIARRCQWRRYAANQQVVGYLDETKNVYFLVGGEARIVIHSASGREVYLGHMKAGEVFGELAAIDGRPRSATVVVLSDALIASMPPAIFWDVVLKHDGVLRELLHRFAGVVRNLSERIVEFSTLAVRARIHAELLRLVRERGQSCNQAVIWPAPTHADIASRVSTHREAVTRELSELARSGLIARRNGALVIRNVAALAEMVQRVRED